jgi:hypothetical protein
MHPTERIRTHVSSPVLDSHHTATILNRRMTCVTSLPRQSSPLKAEEDFHTRDVDSSSWYLKPDHDVIMTSAKYGRVAFQLISRHVKSTKSATMTTSTRPEQLNVEADQRVSTKFYPVPPARPSARRHRISPVAKYARSEPNFLSTSFEGTFKNATTGQTRSMIPAGVLTDPPVPDSLTTSGHSWSNLVILVTHRTRTTMQCYDRPCPQCNKSRRSSSVPLPVQARGNRFLTSRAPERLTLQLTYAAQSGYRELVSHRRHE